MSASAKQQQANDDNEEEQPSPSMGQGGEGTANRAAAAVANASGADILDRYQKSSHMSDVMEAFRRMRGVAAVMMMNNEGMLGKSNFDKVTSGMYCGLANQILKKVQPLIHRLSPTNKLRAIRSNGCGQELIIAPVDHEDLIFVIVQNCTDRASIASNCLKPIEKRHRHHQHHPRRRTTTTKKAEEQTQGPRGSLVAAAEK